MPVFADRIMDTSATTGTGAVTVSGAPPSTYFAFASLSIGTSFDYVIAHRAANEVEVGRGTLTGATTFSRDAVFSSSNAGAAVAFSIGTKDVFLTVAAASMVDKGGDTFTGAVTAPSFVGNLTGNASGAAGSVAASAITGTTLAAGVTASSLTSVGTLAALTVTAPIAGSVTGASGSTTGNAATATALATARAINGVSFDGSAAITVTAAAGTLTGATLAAGVTASSLTSVGTLGSLTVTAPITGSVTGAAGSVAASAITGTTLAAGVTASSLTSVGTLAAPDAVTLAVGDPTLRTFAVSGGSAIPALQVNGSLVGSSMLSAARWSATSSPGTLALGYSAGAAIGTHTIVADTNVIGRITFEGSDGSAFREAARIECVVDGTPGASDMPGSLKFYVTPDASATPVLALTINQNKSVAVKTKLGINNKTPVADVAAPAVATDLATAITLVNDLRTRMINFGIYT